MARTTSRRARTLLVVSAGSSPASDDTAKRVAGALAGPETDVVYLGPLESATQIATAVTTHGADSVELCLGDRGGVQLLRELLRELIRIGRGDVSIVVHRPH